MNQAPSASETKQVRFDEAIRSATCQDGESLYELSCQSTTLVLFLRHSGCTFCREALGDLRSERDALRAQEIDIAVVHMDEPSRAEKLFAKYDLGDVHRFSDPDCVVYDAFEIERGTLLQVLGPRVWWRGFFTAIVRGHGFGQVAGDIFRLPAVFLLRNGKLEAEQRGKASYARLAFDALVSRLSTCEIPKADAES